MGKRHDILLKTLEGISPDETFTRVELVDRMVAQVDTGDLTHDQIQRYRTDFSRTISIGIKYRFLEVVDYRSVTRGNQHIVQSPLLRKVVDE